MCNRIGIEFKMENKLLNVELGEARYISRANVSELKQVRPEKEKWRRKSVVSFFYFFGEQAVMRTNIFAMCFIDKSKHLLFTFIHSKTAK